jgi:aerobic carbon-monoxide dehydrogenase medium subunit
LQIADPQVRYCGTLGGNVANGDPGNDIPAVMVALGATYRVKGTDGERDVAARDFYEGAYSAAPHHHWRVWKTAERLGLTPA